MRLLRLKVDGFGVLRGEYVFDPDRVAIVIDDNERGKTSLLGAITAGLYGVDADARRSRALVTPLERWRPWDGGSYRVELEVEASGERYTVTRDFARGTTEVWNARGQDVAHEFRVGKDEYPVGHKLLGLDAEEFAKCALWRQGELDVVVPNEEKDRRASTLHTRLETAADTRSGDASAIEAQRALRAAVERFHSPLLGTTLRIENAQARLQIQRDTLETELRSLEHEHREIAQPLEDLARLEEEERAHRERIAALELQTLRLRAEEARTRLERDTSRRVELDALRAEAATLVPAAAVAENAESVLREKVALLAAARRTLETLASRHDAARAEHDRRAVELAELSAWAPFTADDADRLAGAAAGLRRLNEEAERARAELAAVEARMYVPASELDIDALVRRFDAADEEKLAILRQQPRLALSLQADIATAEFARNTGRDSLRTIGAWRRPRYLVSALVVAIAIAGATVALTLAPPEFRIPALAGAGVLALGGIVGFIATWRGRRRDRETAAQRVADADEQLRQARLRTTENDARLAQLAAVLGVADAPTLLDEWSEFQQVREQYGPLRAARDRFTALERQREDLLTRGSEWLGAGSTDDAALETAANGIRQRLERARTSLECERRMKATHEEVTSMEGVVSVHRDSAFQALTAAGVPHEGGESWGAWIDAAATRVRQAARHRTLATSLIPALERELLDETQRDAHIDEITRGSEQRPPGPLPVNPVAIAGEISAARQRLDAIARAREELRLRVEGVARRYHQEHPEKLARIEELERELARTARFREAVTVANETIERVARETHRRWAEFLNERVSDLLETFGSSIGSVRFGDDLDFAITMANGQPVARGRAVNQLSSGARDQLHLAVRLAISEYLSRGAEPIPFLIDDCFATSDDGRARNGMRLLLEKFSRGHQIVMVTCHRERHKALANLDPELYAERVQWVELRPAVVA